jgi:hypothetical protein
MPEISILPEEFYLRRWDDPVLEQLGFPVNSLYTEAVLLPILGPSATFCLRRLGAWAAAEPDGTTVDTRQLAGDLGLGDSLARHSPITRTVHRLCQFDMADWQPDELSVRTAVAPLSEHHLRRLSPPVLEVHYALVRRLAARHENDVASRPALRAVPDPPQPAPTSRVTL